MADFEAMAKAIAQKNGLDIDEQINQVNMHLSQLKLSKAEQKAAEKQATIEEQRQKQQDDIVAKLLKDNRNKGGPVSVGGDFLQQMGGQPEIEPEAEGLPLLNNLTRS